MIPIRKPSPASPELPRGSAAPNTVPASAPLVLVAHDSEVVRKMVADLLIGDGFRVDTATDGAEALNKAMETRPHGMILDVGLPGIYGFEICERLKTNPSTSAIKIVLLSSVYDMRRYKRTPTNLYGADDYIEKHHIPDFLLTKLHNLIFPEKSTSDLTKTAEHAYYSLPEMSRPPAREFASSLLDTGGLSSSDQVLPESPLHPSARQSASMDKQEGVALTPDSLSLDASIFQKEEYDIPRVDETDPEAVEKARRFARIIVSDIALYNQEAVIEGLKNGTMYELLNTDITEGRELYEGRVPGVVKAKKDYYQEAFDNFVAAAKKKNIR
jgi:CheY-like chemotaxis protein